MAQDPIRRNCLVVLHDDRISTRDVLCGGNIMSIGDLAYLSSTNAKTLLIKPMGHAENRDQISLHVLVAERFGFGNRIPGTISFIENADSVTATHVELLFRDQHLTRADMWQLIRRLAGTVICRGQTVKYLDTSTAEVVHVYHEGVEVESAYVQHPRTKPIFRSGSSRFTLLVEVSREMLECWSNGDLMYERLIRGYLDELFRRWRKLQVRHQVSVVLFGRKILPEGDIAAGQASSRVDHPTDFYYVLASEISSDAWREIVRKLRQAFSGGMLPRNVSLAAEGNMLEAINLAAMDFADDRKDTQLISTGTSIIAITAGAGLFNANHALIKHTTELLIGNSIGVDIVALSPKPLHPVPLFQYRNKDVTEYALPHWVDISFWGSENDTEAKVWNMDDFVGPVKQIAVPFMDGNAASADMMATLERNDSAIFAEGDKKPAEPSQSPTTTMKTFGTSLETLREMKVEEAYQPPRTEKKAETSRPTSSARSRSSSNVSSPSMVLKEQIHRAKREALPFHPLMSASRKISIGPKGLAITRGAASTVLSTQHAQHEKELPPTTPQPPNEPSGIAKAIRNTLARKHSSMSLTSQRISELDSLHTSKPIDIITGAEASSISSSDDDNHDDIVTVVERGINKTTLESTMEEDGTELSKTLKPTIHQLGSEVDPSMETLDMLSPWVTLLNPCNPRRDNMRVASQYRKWQHVFPRAISIGHFKWSSMCTPAALPLTAEYCPTPAELERYYDKTFRRHIVQDSLGPNGENAQSLLERLIDLRLLQGFQIVSITNSGSDATYQTQDRPLLLALGRRYHELQCLSDFEIQVVQYEPRTENETREFEVDNSLSIYRPVLRTCTGYAVHTTIAHYQHAHVENWTSLDEHILRLAPLPETSASFKLRFVLIPVELQRPQEEGYDATTTTSRHQQQLSDDEKRIEGIQRLTQAWQRQRHFTLKDQQHHVQLAKSTKSNIPSNRDPNPLAIEYHTRDTSVLVNAYGPLLSSHLKAGEAATPLFAESEKHHSSDFDLTKLVKQMQEPPPNGVEMRDRRWLAFTHTKCFRGDEMTTWLLNVFKDLDLRDDAVEVGNELMNRGVFTHVRQKHKFRDGHYFYQISAPYRTSSDLQPPTTSAGGGGMFSKAPWRTSTTTTPAATTPMSENITSPMSRPTISGAADSTTIDSSSRSTSTPMLGPADKKELLLSQVLQYNVDPRKTSGQLQLIDLHYDRIHNPENCYHITLQWLGTSTKLVQSAVSRWAGLVEDYGLKLCQVPLQEISRYHEHHPFDQPQSVYLAVQPPEVALVTPVIEPQTQISTTSTPTPSLAEGGQVTYHKAILRANDFVLDYEAASAFSTRTHARYSWGPLRYAYTQFVHRSGLVIAQILGGGGGPDDGGKRQPDFVLLPNPTATRKPGAAGGASRAAAATAKTQGGATETAEEIIHRFVKFCRDRKEVERVYQEAHERRRMMPNNAGSPFVGGRAEMGGGNGGNADADVPPMSLPPHLGYRAQLRNLL